MRFLPAIATRIRDAALDRVFRNHDERIRQLVDFVQGLNTTVSTISTTYLVTTTAAADYLRIDGTVNSTGAQTFDSGITIGGNALSDSFIAADGIAASDLALATAGYVDANYMPLGSGVTDHGALTGLGDVADHPDYLLIDGTRASTGAQTFSAGVTLGGHTLTDTLISSDGASTSDTVLVTPGWIDSNVSSGSTLDGAYDFGGAGVGRTVEVSDGAVVLANTTSLDTNNILEISKVVTGGDRAGHLIALTNGVFHTGDMVSVDFQSNSANVALDCSQSSGSSSANQAVAWSETVAGSASVLDIARLASATGPGIRVDKPSLGTASVVGDIAALYRNSSAASAGAQQNSPMVALEGRGWKTAATAASRQVWMALQTKPVQGTANPSAELHVLAKIFTGGFSSVASFDSGGGLLLTGDLDAVNISASGDLDAAGGFRRTIGPNYISSPATGTTYTLKLDGSLAGSDALGWFVMPRNGSVVELSAWSDADIAAGQIDFWVESSTDGGDTWGNEWGSSGTPIFSLDSASNPEVNAAAQAKGTSTANAGNVLRVRVATDGSFSGGRTIFASMGVEC